ncbi:AraC family transcriptional regulator [Paenibacillus sp.]|uniref:helix-turn-helix domain-containing protein n=1 Tax=Paenibacillus sp. TaxID=58172 RepID=UPI002D42680D|nr:AraC family transcriptional regulator [Paenibacillus sp.]HZG83996.1 AraC family transcriptional regulator [Paenibacillus sp.]
MEYDRRVGHYTMNRFHIHRCYEMYYLFSGERGFFIKDRTYRLRAGDLVLIDSNEVHKSRDIGVPNHERVVYYYEMPFFERCSPEETELLLAPLRGSRVLRLTMKEKLQFETLIHSFFDELCGALPGYELQLRHIASGLLLLASRFAARRSDTYEEEPTPIKQKITEMIQYINANFRETIRIQTLSEKFYISPGYVSRMFKETTGFSLTEYINIVRCREAQRLLRETDWSITEISEQVGFDNFSHFGKMFKRIVQTSPRAYRKQSKET